MLIQTSGSTSALADRIEFLYFSDTGMLSKGELNMDNGTESGCEYIELREENYPLFILSVYLTYSTKAMIMNVDSKKVELIDWIAELKDESALGKLLALKKRLNHGSKSKSKIFGSGKHLIEYIDDNFNESLEIFDEYKK